MLKMLRSLCLSLCFFLVLSALFAVNMSFASHPAGDTGFNADVEVGLGYDSNAFKAPSDPYIDFSQAGNPLVDPDIKSGIFIPVDIKATYKSELSGNRYGVFGYRFSGDFYTSSDTDTATEYKHKLSGGMEFVFARDGKKMDSLYAGPYVVSSRDLYVDRDSGDEKLSAGGTDLSERYVYFAYGAEAEYDKRIGYVQFGFDGKYEIRDYKDVVVLSQLDQSYYAAKGYVQIPVGKPSKLKVSYEYSVRDYDERPSRSSDGTALLTNPARMYTYNTFELTLRSDIAKKVDLYLDYSLRTRADDFQGYDDYSRNKYGVRIIYKEGALRLRGKVSLWTRDYDNAFAFDNPTQEAKKYDGTDVELSGEYNIRDKWSVWSGLVYDAESSTDKRYEYDRYQVMAGVKWEY